MKKLTTILFLAIAINGLAQNISHKDIKDYLALCYNDSIYSEYWVTPNCNGSTRNGNGVGIIGTTLLYCPPYLKTEWKHKQPTFEGFILYIDKLYKLK